MPSALGSSLPLSHQGNLLVPFLTCVENLVQLFTDMLLSLSCVRLFVTPWAVAHQASLSKGFSRQESWSELPFPFPADLPNPGIEPASPVSPALVGGFFYH